MTIRRFELHRGDKGIVAEGVQFADGLIFLKWPDEHVESPLEPEEYARSSLELFLDIDAMITAHGDRVVWLDDPGPTDLDEVIGS